jgi:hypothetical protein
MSVPSSPGPSFRRSESAPRVAPVAPPFSPDLQAVFDNIMPPGVLAGPFLLALAIDPTATQVPRARGTT